MLGIPGTWNLLDACVKLQASRLMIHLFGACVQLQASRLMIHVLHACVQFQASRLMIHLCLMYLHATMTHIHSHVLRIVMQPAAYLCPLATFDAKHETHLVFRQAWCNLTIDIACVVFPLMHVPLNKSVVFKFFKPKCFTDVTCVLCMNIVCNFGACSI